MKSKLLILPFIFCICFAFYALFSCHEKLRCDGYPIFNSFFRFNLVDKYGTNQIAAWGSRYVSDSVYLTRIDGTLPNQLEIREDGRIVLSIPDDDNEAKDTFVIRRYYLYLPDIHGHPKADIDTITFKYHFDIACYDAFQVYYNDSLYHDGQYVNFITFTKY